MTLPAGDAESIHDLMQAYTYATDAGDADALAGMFTHDAEWDGTTLGYGVATDPTAIARAILSHHDPDRPMFHFAGPPLLTAVSADEVHARSWCIAGREAPGSPVIYFDYEDVLVRTGDGWRFARRRLGLRRRG